MTKNRHLAFGKPDPKSVKAPIGVTLVFIIPDKFLKNNYVDAYI